MTWYQHLDTHDTKQLSSTALKSGVWTSGHVPGMSFQPPAQLLDIELLEGQSSTERRHLIDIFANHKARQQQKRHHNPKLSDCEPPYYTHTIPTIPTSPSSHLYRACPPPSYAESPPSPLPPAHNLGAKWGGGAKRTEKQNLATPWKPLSRPPKAVSEGVA